jgi:hypothetical protein
MKTIPNLLRICEFKELVCAWPGETPREARSWPWQPHGLGDFISKPLRTPSTIVMVQQHLKKVSIPADYTLEHVDSEAYKLALRLYTTATPPFISIPADIRQQGNPSPFCFILLPPIYDAITHKRFVSVSFLPPIAPLSPLDLVPARPSAFATSSSLSNRPLFSSALNYPTRGKY